MFGLSAIAIPDKYIKGSAVRSKGSVNNSHSSKKIPGLLSDLNENMNVLVSPGFSVLLGCIY
jgi:hypothetical protein